MPPQLPSHLSASLAPTQEVKPSHAERDEQQPEEKADGASSLRRGFGKERDAEHDCQDAEDLDGARMHDHAARSRGVATMTRHGACRRTKSTESPKIWRRPLCSRTRRG